MELPYVLALTKKNDGYNFFFFSNKHICSYLELFFSLRLDSEFLNVGGKTICQTMKFP